MLCYYRELVPITSDVFSNKNKKMLCRVISPDSFDRYFLSAFVHVVFNLHTACPIFLKDSQLSVAALMLKIN